MEYVAELMNRCTKVLPFPEFLNNAADGLAHLLVGQGRQAARAIELDRRSQCGVLVSLVEAVGADGGEHYGRIPLAFADAAAIRRQPRDVAPVLAIGANGAAFPAGDGAAHPPGLEIGHCDWLHARRLPCEVDPQGASQIFEGVSPMAPASPPNGLLVFAIEAAGYSTDARQVDRVRAALERTKHVRQCHIDGGVLSVTLFGHCEREILFVSKDPEQP
jgi:hypothetical protein